MKLNLIKNFFSRLINNCSAQAATEYAVSICIIIIVLFAAIIAFQQAVGEYYILVTEMVCMPVP